MSSKTKSETEKRIELGWIVNFGVLGLSLSLLLSWYFLDVVILSLVAGAFFLVGVILSMVRSLQKSPVIKDCKKNTDVLLKNMKMIKMLFGIMDLISFVFLLWLFILILM